MKRPFRAETHRTLGRLRDLIEDADLRHRDIEERAGWSPGYVSQLLGGHVELRLSHLEPLLKALDIDPARFFREMFPRQAPSRASTPGKRKVSRLKVNPDVVEIYDFGIESLRGLHLRMDECEKAITTVARQAVVKKRIKGLG